MDWVIFIEGMQRRKFTFKWHGHKGLTMESDFIFQISVIDWLIAYNNEPKYYIAARELHYEYQVIIFQSSVTCSCFVYVTFE